MVVRGTIRRRLLVNALVDPDEAATRLPPELRPLVHDGATVVGCCLLDLGAVRPAGVPAPLGRRLRAAAHRIAVTWTDVGGDRVAGVYVPVRHTDARLAVAVGGRWFPGVHEPAGVRVDMATDELRWVSEPTADGDGLGIRVAVTVPADRVPTEACGPVAATCLGATLGVSPDRRGRLEVARMALSHRRAVEVAVEDVASGFLAGFATARPAPAYLLVDADVTWSPAPTPAQCAAGPVAAPPAVPA